MCCLPVYQWTAKSASQRAPTKGEPRSGSRTSSTPAPNADHLAITRDSRPTSSILSISCKTFSSCGQMSPVVAYLGKSKDDNRQKGRRRSSQFRCGQRRHRRLGSCRSNRHRRVCKGRVFRQIPSDMWQRIRPNALVIEQSACSRTSGRRSAYTAVVPGIQDCTCG